MRQHKRAPLVQKARGDIGYMVLQYAIDNDLTSIELLQCLNEAQASTLKYMLREERHPDNPDTPADQE